MTKSIAKNYCIKKKLSMKIRRYSPKYGNHRNGETIEHEFEAALRFKAVQHKKLMRNSMVTKKEKNAKPLQHT